MRSVNVNRLFTASLWLTQYMLMYGAFQEGTMKPTNINFEESTRRDLKKIAKKLTKETGVKVTSAALVRLAVQEWLRGRV